MIYSKFILDAKIFLYYIPYIVNIIYYKYSCEKKYNKFGYKSMDRALSYSI